MGGEMAAKMGVHLRFNSNERFAAAAMDATVDAQREAGSGSIHLMQYTHPLFENA